MDAGASGGGCGGGQGEGCGSCGPGKGVAPAVGKRDGVAICVKCKQGVAAKVVANQTEPLCQDCLHHSLLSKFKTAVNNHGLVTPSDKVLVAFSGGPASRIALDFLLQLRAKAQGNADGCEDQQLPVFEVGVAFVDESTFLGISAAESAQNLEDIRAAVASASPELIPLHVEPLESVMAVEGACLHTRSPGADGCIPVSGDGGNVGSMSRDLLDLFGSIKDETGREDLQEQLRMLVLQKVAEAHGYTKIILGLCTSRIAAQVIASTAKGRGFSLPADIQYFDSRFRIPVILPLRDCVVRELVLYCHFAKLKTVFIRKPSTLLGNISINNLAHSFVAMLQEENPSREHTIVRTATKLKPFEFNNLGSDAQKLLRRRRLPRQQGSVGSELEPLQASETIVLCALCHAPLDRRDHRAVPSNKSSVLPSENSGELASHAQDFRNASCPSCQYQILTEDNLASTFHLLPPMLKQQDPSTFGGRRSWMRSRIADSLI